MSLLHLSLGTTRSVRGIDNPSHGQIFSTNEFVNYVCDKEANNAYGKSTFHRIKENPAYKDEIETLSVSFKFPGRNQRTTPCMAIPGLRRLLEILGNKVTTSMHETVKEVLTRIMAGDQSFIRAEPDVPGLDEACVKRKRDHDEQAWRLELDERQQRIEELKLRNEDKRLEQQDKRLDQIQKCAILVQKIRGFSGIDEHTKFLLENHAKNQVLDPTSVPITGIPVEKPVVPEHIDEPVKPQRLYVSSVAKQMGFNCSEPQRMKIGSVLLDKYVARYGRIPKKDTQTVGYEEIMVNVYPEQDRDMMEAAINEVMLGA